MNHKVFYYFSQDPLGQWMTPTALNFLKTANFLPMELYLVGTKDLSTKGQSRS